MGWLGFKYSFFSTKPIPTFLTLRNFLPKTDYGIPYTFARLVWGETFQYELQAICGIIAKVAIMADKRSNAFYLPLTDQKQPD